MEVRAELQNLTDQIHKLGLAVLAIPIKADPANQPPTNQGLKMANDNSKKTTWTNDGASGITKSNNPNIERGMSGVTKSNQSGNQKPSGEKPKSS